MFEVTLEKRGRSRWWWRVQDLSGKAFMTGWENSRSEAKYQGERALFLLLMTTGRIYDPPQTSWGSDGSEARPPSDARCHVACYGND